jgi:hypothetical protein
MSKTVHFKSKKNITTTTLMIVVIKNSKRNVSCTACHVQHSAGWGLLLMRVDFGGIEIAFVMVSGT